MADQDLLTYAQDAANRGDDLFAILGTDATASESDIRRAFRRKALTAHPDKAGDAYDPQLYERLERARDVLTTAEARAVYDNGMRALLQKKVERERMSEKRRRLVEDLERREAEAAKRVRMQGVGVPDPQDAERRAMAARGRAKMEEMRRKREEAEVRERLAGERSAAAAAAAVPIPKPDSAANATPTQKQTQTDDGLKPGKDEDYDSRIADLEKRLRESQQRKAEKQQRKEERRRAEMKARGGSPLLESQPQAQTQSSHDHPPAAHAEPQADEDRVSAPVEKPTTTTTTARTTSTEAGVRAGAAAATEETPGAPKASDKFASTLARLRAAQAKREEEKKRSGAVA